jgi:hypothetical protein
LRLRFTSICTALLLTSSPAWAVMEDYPSVKLQGLDKSVGRTITFEAKVGSTIQYGPLYIKIHSCRKAPPIEKPESASFLQIWEVPPGAQKSEWVFSGWMFASSPALSAMDHPVYDVWVQDCSGKEAPNEAAAVAESEKEADQTNLPTVDAAVPEGAAPSIRHDEPQAEDDIPVDGEADMSGDDPTAPVPSAVADPDAPYVPPSTAQPSPSTPTSAPTSTAPVEVDGFPQDPDAAPAPRIDGATPDMPSLPETPSARVYDPATEGVYSPSLGRIVYPDEQQTPPVNQAPDYDPSAVPQYTPNY